MTVPNGETQPVADEVTEPPVGEGAGSVEQTDEQEAEAQRKADEQADMDALPEWARKALTKANSEAANYRTRLREAEDRLSTAKTPEEFQAAVDEVKSKNAELERSLMTTRVASKYKLPEALVSRLQGETEADMEKDAQALMAVIKTDPKTLGGGLTPNGGEPVTTDPRALRKQGRRR